MFLKFLNILKMNFYTSFIRDLKFSRVDSFLISSVKLFHKLEAPTLNNTHLSFDFSKDMNICRNMDDMKFWDHFQMDIVRLYKDILMTMIDVLIVPTFVHMVG